MTVGAATVLGVLTAAICLSSTHGCAYETSTHQAITQSAFERSTLGRGFLEEELGLRRDAQLRAADGKAFIPQAWMVEGSEREDDFNLLSFAPLRFRHHFYDPVYDRGLTANRGIGVAAGLRSFEWSFESVGDIAGQDFSWRDGRRYFSNALTLRDRAEREYAMAQTFRTLGHVVHLIQDMAVPEHTRNDWHAGVFAPLFPFGSPSLFEKHVQALEPGLTIGTYQPPRFPTLQQFWTGGGRGLAEFTNRNFISQGTNFTQAADGDTGHDNFGNPYPLPQLSLEQLVEFDVATDRAPSCLAAAGLAGNVTFYGNQVDDLVTGEVIPNEFMTTYSLFDAPLRSKGQPGIFTVNFCTVEAAATILLPRAVGYSTALIDYFFRGKLDVAFDGSSVDADTLTVPLQVVNRSPEPLGPGTLAIYVDHPATGQRNAVAGATLTLTASVPPDSAIAQRLNLDVVTATQPMTLVYQGQLGQEAGAIIGKVYDGMLVEEVFFDGAQWRLRAPSGIFPLGLGAEVHELKWGDRDNTLLAQTFLAGQGRRLQAYRINRPENSSRIPLVGATVDLVPWGDPVFFTGSIDLGTTVVLSRTTEYAQELATVRGQFTYHFDATLQDWVQDSAIFEPAEVETVFADVFGGTGAYPLILAADPGLVPYRTFIDDVFLDGAGDVIALVAADDFVLPGPAPGPIFARRRDKAGALVVLEDPRSWFPFSAPDFADLGPVFNDRIWFVVNLARRTVLAKSCDDTVSLAYATRQRRLLADLVTNGERFRITMRPAESTDQLIGTFSGGTFDITAAAQSGLYRSEFLTQGFGESSFHTAEFTNPLSGFRDPVPRRNVSLGAALRARGSVRAYDKEPRQLYEVRRADGRREAYTVLGRNAGVEGDFTASNTQWSAWQWSTSTHTLRALAPFVALSPAASGDMALVEANRTGAMFLEFRFDPATLAFSMPSHVLTTSQAFWFADDITASYRLLDTPFAYNVDDGRFHRMNAMLDVLPGPRPLAAGGSTFGTHDREGV